VIFVYWKKLKLLIIVNFNLKFNIINQIQHTMAKLSIQLLNLLNQDEIDQFIELIKQNPGCGAQLDSMIPMATKDTTLMHIALKDAKIDFVRALVENGASLHIKPSLNGHDSLYEAIYRYILYVKHGHVTHNDSEEQAKQRREQFYNIIVYLLGSGANPNTQDKYKWPILMWMCSEYNGDKVKHIIKNIAALLVDHGMIIDTEIRYDGLTLEENAKNRNNGDIIEYVMNYQPEPITKGHYCDDGPL